MQKISLQDKQNAAIKFGLEYKCVAAVMAVEAAGSGYNDQGKLKIQFEPHVFHGELTARKIDHTFEVIYKVANGKKVVDKYKITHGGLMILNGVEGQVSEYNAYNVALQINAEAAMMATSFGLGQVMGFNHLAAGYLHVADMVKAFEESEYNQLIGMLMFIKSNSAMFNALLHRNWAAFAEKYNGPNYKINNYDIKLATAYAAA